MKQKTESKGNNNPMVIPVLQARQTNLIASISSRRNADEAKQPIGRFDKPSE